MNYEEVGDSFVKDYYPIIPNDNKSPQIRWLFSYKLYRREFIVSATLLGIPYSDNKKELHGLFNSCFNRLHPNIFTLYIKICTVERIYKNYIANLIKLYNNKNISRLSGQLKNLNEIVTN